MHSTRWLHMLVRASRLWFVCIAALLNGATASAQVELVDPSIGGQGFLLEPTRPTVSLPNSMVRVYPVRKDQLDDQIHSFPLTIISHRLGRTVLGNAQRRHAGRVGAAASSRSRTR